MSRRNDDEEEHDLPPLIPMTEEELNTPMPHEPEDLLDFDSVEKYTQHIRLRMVRKMNKQLAQIDDPQQQTVMLKALSDMDKAVVNKRRLGIEEEAQKSADEQSRNVSELLRGIKTQMFQADPRAGAPVRTAPKLDQAVPITFVPGETINGTTGLNYDDFVKGIPTENSDK